MPKIIFKEVFKYDHTRVYHAIGEKLTIIFSVEFIKDNKGTLCRAESSQTGHFEEYGLKAVKTRITNVFNK
jgi:hypothetical protein